MGGILSIDDIQPFVVLFGIFFVILGSIAAFAAEPWMRVVGLVTVFPAWFALAFIALGSVLISVCRKPTLGIFILAAERAQSSRKGFLFVVAVSAFTVATFFSTLLGFYRDLVGLD